MISGQYFKKLKIAVLGVSTDSVKSHKKFEEKYGLPFALFADEEKKVVNRYGVWGKKNLQGTNTKARSVPHFSLTPKATSRRFVKTQNRKRMSRKS
jgi:peroxiredoxin Q/BCP